MKYLMILALLASALLAKKSVVIDLNTTDLLAPKAPQIEKSEPGFLESIEIGGSIEFEYTKDSKK